jgi:hypothetical protein
MPEINRVPETARFLRTLRVATASAIARHDLVQGARSHPATTRFLALAAKGRDDWRFPADGLLSGDGLVRASLVDEPGGSRALVLQALGAAGLMRYADLAIVLRLRSGQKFAGAFNRDGAFRLALNDNALGEVDLAGFEIGPEEDAR